MKFYVTATIEYPNGVAPGKDQLERVRKNLLMRLDSVYPPVNVIALTVEAKPNSAPERIIPSRCECGESE
jgi:hypothetical protein